MTEEVKAQNDRTGTDCFVAPAPHNECPYVIEYLPEWTITPGNYVCDSFDEGRAIE